MDHQFLPAIIPYVIYWHEVPDGEGTVKLPIQWLDPDWPQLYYGPVLFSYLFWHKRDGRRALNQIRSDQLMIFGDSGGYSVVTRGASVDPTEVIRWQCKECTRGVILDIPPYSRESVIQFTGTAHEHWEDSIRRTRLNVTRALPLYLESRRAGTKFRWWGVIQGETWDQMAEWHDAVSDIYSFTDEGEGWALAPKPSTDFLSVVRHLRFAYERELRNVHLLQVTSPRIVAAAFALAQMSDGFDLITYDSASGTRCAINRAAVVPDPDNFSFAFLNQKGMEGRVHDHLMQCPCQYCKWFREFQHVMDNRAYTHYLLAHNQVVMQESFDRLWAAAVADPDKLLRWAARERYGAVLREWHEEAHHHHAKPQTRAVGIYERLRQKKNATAG